LFTAVPFQDDLLTVVREFVRSDWSLKSRSLKTLRLADSCLDVARLLTALRIGDVGISTVILPGNVFRNPIDPSFVTFLPPDLVIDVSSCGFLNNHLFDFLSALQLHNGRSLKLSVAVAAISNPVWKDFLAKVDQLVLPTLTSLTWNLNRLSPTVLTFFARQPKLRSLSISDCVSASDFAALLRDSTSQIQDLRLTKLVWCASCADTSLGAVLSDVVLGCLRDPLRSLDLSGQRIGADGLSRIVARLPAAMAELAFDGSGIADLRRLLGILRQLFDAGVRAVAWPEADVRASLAAAEPADAAAARGELERLSGAFAERAAAKHGGEEEEVAAEEGAAPPDEGAKIHAFPGQVCESSQRFRIRVPANEDFVARFVIVQRDPVELMYRELEEETSIEVLKRVLDG
jgi:hypothetical protein